MSNLREDALSSEDNNPLNVKYYYSLDLLRGLGAIAILITHYRHFYITEPLSSSSPVFSTVTDHYPFNRLLAPLYSHGGFAVQLFWELSGFVFAFIYLKRHINLRQFFVYRFSRLYPLHFLTLVLILVLQYYSLYSFGAFQIISVNDLRHFVLNIFFAQAWGFEDSFSFNSPSWSLSVEEVVYGCFWLLLSLRAFSSPLKRWSLVFLSLAFLPLFSLSRIIFGWAPSDFIPLCLFFFFFGITTFSLHSSSNSSLNVRWIFVYLLSAILLYSFVRLPPPYCANASATYCYLRFTCLKNLSLACFFSSLLLFFALIDSLGLAARFHRLFKRIGSLTYSTYMLHVPLQVLVLIAIDSFSISRTIFDSPMAMIAYLALNIVIGRLSYLYFEAPAQAFIRRRFA
jgi:peptidoglycan/LPS O-acetylase OafA/YrhL